MANLFEKDECGGGGRRRGGRPAVLEPVASGAAGLETVASGAVGAEPVASVVAGSEPVVAAASSGPGEDELEEDYDEYDEDVFLA